MKLSFTGRLNGFPVEIYKILKNRKAVCTMVGKLLTRLIDSELLQTFAGHWEKYFLAERCENVTALLQVTVVALATLSLQIECFACVELFVSEDAQSMCIFNAMPI